MPDLSIHYIASCPRPSSFQHHRTRARDRPRGAHIPARSCRNTASVVVPRIKGELSVPVSVEEGRPVHRWFRLRRSSFDGVGEAFALLLQSRANRDGSPRVRV
jgi:hypothetical protein